MAKRVVIIGGGISGLSAALKLTELGRGVDGSPLARLIESRPTLGGQIHTEQLEDCLLEGGPDSLVAAKPAGVELCHRLGLDSELLEPRTSDAGMQVVHDGRLVQLPAGFMPLAPTRLRPLLRLPLLSWSGKARAALERLVPATRGRDESLREFVTRRFGREVFERLAEPILAGLFTADAETMSVEMTVPRFRELERRHGSVTAGLRKTAGRRPAGPAVLSLRGGMMRIVERLTERLPEDCVSRGRSVVALQRDGAGWVVELDGGIRLRAGAVILACPTWVSATLLAPIDRSLAARLGAVEYASCATINLIYRKTDLSGEPRSFGFFVPRRAGLPILACSHVSAKFAGRAPEHLSVLRVFVGGALNPGMLERDDGQLVNAAHETLRELLDLRDEPRAAHVHRCPESMPQFRVGHREVLDEVSERIARHPGLFLSGAAVGSIGIPDCIRTGESAATGAVEHVIQRSRRLELAI